MDADDPIARRRAARARHARGRLLALAASGLAVCVVVAVVVAAARTRHPAVGDAARPAAPGTAPPEPTDPDRPPGEPTPPAKGARVTVRGLIVGQTMRVEDFTDFGLGEGDGLGEGVLVVQRAGLPPAYCYFPRAPGASIPGVPAGGRHLVTVTGVVIAGAGGPLVLQDCRLVSVEPARSR